LQAASQKVRFQILLICTNQFCQQQSDNLASFVA